MELVFLLITSQISGAVLSYSSYIYQKDVSEYCLRRVLPSVFLGREVMETNSQTFHFSQLDLPYSCSISVRSEPGSNIILMIQTLNPYEWIESCAKYSNQFLVYEFGETFGGYWGALSNALIEPEPEASTKQYTLATSDRRTTLINKYRLKEKKENLKFSTNTTPKPEQTAEDDGMVVEIPLVNVSGQLLPGVNDVKKSFDIDDTFQLTYDVTPRSEDTYYSSILPLVQFSIKRQEPGRRFDGESELELDYRLRKFTPDFRLSFPQVTTRLSISRTKKKRKQNFLERKRSKWRKSQGFLSKELIFPSIVNNYENRMSVDGGHINIQQRSSTESYNLIDDIINSLRNSTEITTVNTKVESHVTSLILKSISDMEHNASVYLASNLPTFMKVPISKEVKDNLTKLNRNTTFTHRSTVNNSLGVREDKLKTIKFISTISYVPNYDLNKSRTQKMQSAADYNTNNDKITVKLESTSGDNVFESNTLIATSIAGKIENDLITVQQMSEKDIVDHRKKFTLRTDSSSRKYGIPELTSENVLSGTMVGHESWENVVQAAPEMAVLLNVTKINTAVLNQTRDQASQTLMHRKKRRVSPISIDIARPHQLTTRRTRPTTERTVPQLSDMQDFAQLVELPDDEMINHVSLRYLRQYAGPTLFNMCDFRENPKTVMVFNTSRIIISLTNFTIPYLTMVATSAHTLATNTVEQCPPAHLECQIGVSRVCIDSSNACDGVPNCGAYDIYDEDKRHCGEILELQRNIYLATVTCLAALVTICYIIYYWLNRCVPKVSEAFFIYTYGAENILYLDPIMRSPTDVSNFNKATYPGMFFEDTMYPIDEGKPRSFFQRLLSKMVCFRRRVPQKLHPSENIESGMFKLDRKKYSFTELEIRNMISSAQVHTGVQTGESLEMENLTSSNDLGLVNSTHRLFSNELNVLNLVNSSATNLVQLEAESSSSIMGRKIGSGYEAVRAESVSAIDEESELQNTLFEHHDSPVAGTSLKSGSTVTDIQANVKKHLRFEELPTTIPSDDDSDITLSASPHRFIQGSGLNRSKQQPTYASESIREDTERGRLDIRRLWGSHKGKKTKK